jgi:hypothetical protein
MPEPNQKPPDNWCGPRRFALALAILVFIPFWKVLAGIDTFAVRDFGLFSFPNAYFQRQCFWNGELPWWNPYNCCGLPFLAQFNTLALYPPSLIYLLLPLTWSLPFFCLLHLYVGGLGMYFLAARWTGSWPAAVVAGVAFAFNGLTLNFLMWPSHIATFAWLPWVIYLTEIGWRNGGRKIVAAAAVAALQVLAGGPESILFTWLIVLGIALMECRRGGAILGRRLVLIGLLAVGLASTQWLPFMDFVLHCSRNTHYANSDWPMPAWGWANFLVPQFHTSIWQGMAMQHDQYWTSSYYAGIGIVFLTAMALSRRSNPRMWLIAGFAAVSLILSLGDHGLVYPLLRKVFPFLGFFRFPIKFTIITSAALPLLAAFAISQYESSARFGRREMVCGSLMVLLTAATLWFENHFPGTDDSWPVILCNGLSRAGFLAAIFAAVWFFATQRARRAWSIWVIVAACWLDLITGVPWQNPTLDPTLYQPGLGRLYAKLDPQPTVGQSRLMLTTMASYSLFHNQPPDLKTAFLLDRASFLSDCNLMDDLPKVDGFFSLYLREIDKVLWLLDPSKGPQLAKLEDFLCVCQTIAPGKVLDWIPRSTYMPVVTCGQGPVFAGDKLAFAAILQTNVDFRKVVFLPLEAQSQVTAQREPGARVTVKHFGNNREDLQVETPSPTMVFVSQAYYHNWKAELDGKEIPVWRANYAFQAIQVPAGSHAVTFVYRDGMFQVGLLLTAAAGLACAVLWLGGKAPRGENQNGEQQPAN